MCFRDMTFCIAECANTNCPRKYTDKVQRFAEIWWGSKDAPISLGDMSEGCKDYQPVEDTK